MIDINLTTFARYLTTNFAAIAITGALALGSAAATADQPATTAPGPNPVTQEANPDALLSVLPPQPGLAGQINMLTAVGVTPGEDVYFYYGFEAGQTVFPPCPFSPLLIDRPKWAGIAVADETGTALLWTRVPAKAEGVQILLQVAEPDACLTSEVLAFTFSGD